jgi:hypothetical protein
MTTEIHEFEFADGSRWHVRAYAFPTGDAAHAEWLRLVDENPVGDFSAWRTATPEGDVHLVVVCGWPEKLSPLKVGGTPFPLDDRSAGLFALRRARVGYDAEQADPEVKRVNMVEHYDQPTVIGELGGVRPYEGEVRR